MNDGDDGIGPAQGPETVEQMADFIEQARSIATGRGDELIAYFLDMALHEIAAREPLVRPVLSASC